MKVLDFFDPTPHECIFCGNLDVKRWDHLVPISKGGDTVLGNMVLLGYNIVHHNSDVNM